MATQKMTGPFGMDCAIPKNPVRPCPPPAPPVPPEDWGVYPYYPPYPDMEPEPVPVPPIPGRKPCPSGPSCPPPYPKPYPPMPPYPPPCPDKTDECSKKLAALQKKAKVLVNMINDFEKSNKSAILTIGHNSYNFGVENITNFDGEAAKGMYSAIISGTAISELEEDTYVVDDTETRVALKNPTDLLQSELARVRKEIELVNAAFVKEITGETYEGTPNIPGTGEG